jgi:hypothetical protein
MDTDTIKRIHDERRFKIIYIDTQYLLRIINFKTTDQKTLTIPTVNIPIHDCIVVNCSFSFDHNALGMTIGHINFNPVPIGECIPELQHEEHIITINTDIGQILEQAGVTWNNCPNRRTRGGYIPFCDHRCPPDMKEEDYLY